MDKEMLELIFAFENEKDVKKVSQKALMPPSVFKEKFLRLVSLGLIEKLNAEEVYADNAVIQKMRYMLNQINVRRGDIVLDDTAKLLGMVLDRIPLHELAFFVENLAEKIPSEKNRYTFKKGMLEELKAAGC